MDDDAPEITSIWDEARAYVDQGNYDKAIETYKYILVRYGDNPVNVEFAHANLGDIYLTLKQLDLAETHINKAISCNPKKPDYHYLLGFVYSIQEKWLKAVKEFEQAVKINPNNAEYLRGLGWAFFNGGDKLKGMEYLHEANEKEPSNVNILLDLANAYLTIFDFDRANAYADEALLVDPDSGLAQKVEEKIKEFRKMYEQGKGTDIIYRNYTFTAQTGTIL